MARFLSLGSGGCAGTNLSRCLNDAGHYSIGLDIRPERLELGEWDAVGGIDRTDSPNHLASVLAAIETHRPDLIYAQADSEVFWLSDNRDKVGVPTLLPSREAINLCRDKLCLSHELHKANIPVPMSRWAAQREQYQGTPRHNFNEVAAMSGGIVAGKVWVRAKSGAGSKAALPVSNYDMAAAWIRYWGETRGLSPEEFMFCEFLPGREFAWQAVFMGGNLVTSVTRQRLEYVFQEQMPSGQSSTPSLAEIVQIPDMNRIGEAAVRAIEHTPNGVYGVDAKCDAAGQIRVTEINTGRFYTTSHFYASAGVNLVDIYVKAALGTLGQTWPKLPYYDAIPAGYRWLRSLDAEPYLIAPK